MLSASKHVALVASLSGRSPLMQDRKDNSNRLSWWDTLIRMWWSLSSRLTRLKNVVRVMKEANVRVQSLKCSKMSSSRLEPRLSTSAKYQTLAGDRRPISPTRIMKLGSQYLRPSLVARSCPQCKWRTRRRWLLARLISLKRHSISRQTMLPKSVMAWESFELMPRRRCTIWVAWSLTRVERMLKSKIMMILGSMSFHLIKIAKSTSSHNNNSSRPT